jgi:ubiquinone/menaquinone biosynthesis C-methylase UbiE
MPATTPPRAARFWNRIAKKYAASPVDNVPAYEHKLARTAAFMTPGDRVLEIGCGTGTTALTHAPRVARIDALDFSDAMIDIARDKAAAQGVDNVAFHVATLEDWDTGGYDMVMAHSILHLVPDLDDTLKMIRDRLKPGGIFVSSTACIRDINPVLALVLPLAGWTGLIPKVMPLRGTELDSRITAHGFEILENWRPSPRAALFVIARAV